MLPTAFLCCVKPIAQQKITRSDSRKTRAASSICAFVMPDCSTMSSDLNLAQRFSELFETCRVLTYEIVIENLARLDGLRHQGLPS